MIGGVLNQKAASYVGWRLLSGCGEVQPPLPNADQLDLAGMKLQSANTKPFPSKSMP
jgi:hypothetical protein